MADDNVFLKGPHRKQSRTQTTLLGNLLMILIKCEYIAISHDPYSILNPISFSHIRKSDELIQEVPTSLTSFLHGSSLFTCIR